ncbi:MAG: LysM peptidoglycan-binding domain-containing protein [Gammaproteobacteria bacterium]|nr:LysM peptidoglycan-binding domain-containing protein [Gammaproteobacteria bacterium]
MISKHTLIPVFLWVFVSWSFGTESDANAEETDPWPEQFVIAPFASEIAQTRLREEWNFDPQTISTLESVEKMFWDVDPVQGCPFEGVENCSGRPYVAVTRGYIFSGDKTSADLNRTARALSYPGCDYLNVGSSLLNIDSASIQWGGNWSGADQSCGRWPWGSKYSYKNSWAEGYWRLRMILKKFDADEDGPPFFCFDADYEHRVTDSKGFLGLWDPDTFLGGIIDDVLFRGDLGPGKLAFNLLGSKTTDELMKELKRTIHRDISRVRKALLAAQAGTAKQFGLLNRTFDNYEGRYEFVLDEIYMEKNDTGAFSFFVTEKFFMENPRGEANIAFGNAENMRQIIQGFSDKEEIRTVEYGDSLWKIASDVYGHGEFYHLLIHTNPVLDDHVYLQPGQQIKIRPLVDFSGLVADGRLILPGGTVWDMYTTRFGTSRWNSDSIGLPPGNSSPDLIFPLQVLEWPSHAPTREMGRESDEIPRDPLEGRCKKALGH